MSFELASVGRGGPILGLGIRSKPQKHGHRVSIALGKTLCEEFNIADGDRFTISWGVGGDIGKLLLLPRDDGVKFSRVSNGRSLRGVTTRTPAWWAHDAVSTQHIEYSLHDDGAILAVLPENFIRRDGE